LRAVIAYTSGDDYDPRRKDFEPAAKNKDKNESSSRDRAITHGRRAGTKRKNFG
jgi:hypothetical protein